MFTFSIFLTSPGNLFCFLQLPCSLDFPPLELMSVLLTIVSCFLFYCFLFFLSLFLDLFCIFIFSSSLPIQTHLFVCCYYCNSSEHFLLRIAIRIIAPFLEQYSLVLSFDKLSWLPLILLPGYSISEMLLLPDIPRGVSGL